MKKGIVAIVLVLALLFSMGCGKDTDEVTSPAAGSSGASVSAENDEENENDPSQENEEGYLDEAAGIYHAGNGTRFSLPDGWAVTADGLHAGVACLVGPLEGGSVVIIQEYGSKESAQMVYDLIHEGTSVADNSHEVTYGDNTYISNVNPNEEGVTFFYYTGKSDPIVYFGVNLETLGDDGKIGLEEILSSFSY